MQNKLNEEALENVSGGTVAETEELRAFINKHDPDYVINGDRLKAE